MTDEEAAAIVERDLDRRDRQATVTAARQILRASYGQRLKEAAQAVATADQAVEMAKAEVDRQETTRQVTRRNGGGPTNEAVTQHRLATARLTEAKAAYRALKDADPSSSAPTTPGLNQTCVIDATPFDLTGKCIVCRLPASKVGRAPFLKDSLPTLFPQLARSR